MPPSFWIDLAVAAFGYGTMSATKDTTAANIVGFCLLCRQRPTDGEAGKLVEIDKLAAIMVAMDPELIWGVGINQPKTLCEV
jgi:hypothetical protein